MLALPALAAIAVYLPALPGGFLSDDYSLLHLFYGADAQRSRRTRVARRSFPASDRRRTSTARW